MDQYTVVKKLGEGSFGYVWQAINRRTNEIVAIKKLKRRYNAPLEFLNLTEIKLLKKMNHPNILMLKEIIREHKDLYLVIEYMECNLHQIIKHKGEFIQEDQIRNWCFQLFQGLAHMHQNGYFHRDLKPENLLVTKDTIKIGDLGSARALLSKASYTEYVTTRWYRAPEVLLHSSLYGFGVDMWAMGAIMAEMFALRPIFSGSNAADQIYKICCILGSPDENSWPRGMKLANAISFQFPQLVGVPLSTVIPSASDEAIDLIASLCSWDPCKRPSAAKALQHPFFRPSLGLKMTVASDVRPHTSNEDFSSANVQPMYELSVRNDSVTCIAERLAQAMAPVMKI